MFNFLSKVLATFTRSIGAMIFIIGCSGASIIVWIANTLYVDFGTAAIIAIVCLFALYLVFRDLGRRMNNDDIQRVSTNNILRDAVGDERGVDSVSVSIGNRTEYDFPTFERFRCQCDECRQQRRREQQNVNRR